MNLFLIVSSIILLLPNFTEAGTADLELLIDKMENDVLELAEQVEEAFQDRCTTALNDCSYNNYDSCVSQFLSPTCYKSDELVTTCSSGPSDSCAALFDFNSSNVILPSEIADGKDGNPTNPQVIESVCYTRQLDSFFSQKRRTDADYWRSFGVESPPMFFGSQEGMFRIFPGRHFENCGSFDPRVRPWYIAASSGPKNIVLVLDTSGSMNSGQGQRFVLLKKAAIRVIQTLTVGDRVAIVPFASSSLVIGDSEGRMLTANAENKAILVDAINGLVAEGGTNFYAALGSAFDTMDKTIAAELHNNCNSAVLFLTDGEMTDPPGVTEQDVIELVTNRLNATMQSSGKPILFFTYSIGTANENVHKFPKELACSTELGVWSKIDDESKLFESLTSYYRLFALGLGNKGAVAWVEPYNFATGGVVGTTVSAPVYDRNHDPPLFLGVVGMNFPLTAINKALGSESGNQQAAIDRIVKASTANCPSLNLTLCELESFRRLSSAGDEAICDLSACNASDFVQVEATKCPSVSDYPQYLWINSNFAGKSYLDRVCCTVGETIPSDSCPVPIATSASSTIFRIMVWIWCVVVPILFPFILLCGCVVKKELSKRLTIIQFDKQSSNSTNPSSTHKDVNQSNHEQPLEVPWTDGAEHIATIHPATMVVMPPPSAPYPVASLEQ